MNKQYLGNPSSLSTVSPYVIDLNSLYQTCMSLVGYTKESYPIKENPVEAGSRPAPFRSQGHYFRLPRPQDRFNS